MLKEGLDKHVREVMNLLREELRSILEIQGHGKRGASKLIDSLEYDLISTATAVTSKMFMEDYGVYVDRGVSSENTPFSPGSGRTTSRYIDGLIRFWKRKGLDNQRAKRAAFATARKHKKEGRPTRASFRFSSNGQRTNFLESTLDKNEAKVFNILETKTGISLDVIITNLVNKYSEA